jgi:hypothetical protein
VDTYFAPELQFERNRWRSYRFALETAKKERTVCLPLFLRRFFRTNAPGRPKPLC